MPKPRINNGQSLYLVQSTADIKNWFSGIDDDYNILSMQSFIADAQMDYLVPEIGQDMVNDVVNYYNQLIENPELGLKPSTLGTLLQFLQKATVHFALWLSADAGAFRISDSGFYVSATNTSKPVSDKKLAEFKRMRWKAAYKAVEQAIAFMEANINDDALSDYAGSDIHTAALQYFINDSITFTKYFAPLNRSAITFRAFLNALDYCERTYILPLLGEPMFDDMKANLLAGLNAPAYTALLPLIQRPLAWYTVATAVPNLQLEFDGTNLVINSMPAFGNAENVENKAAAAPNQVGNLAVNAMNMGNSEINRLTTYLLTNAVNYPLYVVPALADQGDIDMNDDPCSGIVFV